MLPTMTRGRKKQPQSQASPVFWFAICLIFLVIGTSEVFGSGHTLLGIAVCVVGVFWLFLGLRYGRRR
jgi:uncharacterized membrane protein